MMNNMSNELMYVLGYIMSKYMIPQKLYKFVNKY